MGDAKSVAEELSLIENDNSKILGLTINGKPIGKEDYLIKQESHSIPEVSLPNSSNTTTYAVVCVDIDVPFPSWDMLGPALHWFQPGLEATVDGVTRNVDNTPAIADYLGASPLPGSSRRRYLVILYEQGHYLNIQNGGNLLYPGSDPV